MDYAAWLLKQINDPATPRAKYMGFLAEYEAIVHNQKRLDAEAAAREANRSNEKESHEEV